MNAIYQNGVVENNCLLQHRKLQILNTFESVLNWIQDIIYKYQTLIYNIERWI